MSSSIDSDEITFWFHDPQEIEFAVPVRISGIHKAVAEKDLLKVRHCIESGESVNKKENTYNFSLLHIAVLDDNLEMLDYLLTKEGIQVDIRCSKGRTPLYLATGLDHIEMVEKLIQAGSDINIADNNNDTALHMSVYYPPICRLLLQHGARIRTDDSRSGTLHAAVYCDCLEIVHMLLYYNVDANVPDTHCSTPFTIAVITGNEEAQKVLLEYVDFNESNFGDNRWLEPILCLALERNSPIARDMIERGIDVNYGEYSAFSACLECPVDLSTFEMVWERLRYDDCANTINLLNFLEYNELVPTFLPVIIESDNFEPAVEFFSKGDNYFLFVNKFADNEFDLDQLTALTCRLLEWGYRATSYDVHTIFSHYGYCELFRILLYMDIDFSRGWLPHMALSRLIFDVDYNLESVIDKINDIPKETVLRLLENSVCPCLIDALTCQYSSDESMITVLGSLPRVPLLIELARNTARKHIWQSLKDTNNSRFYTLIDQLNIPTAYKNLLTFKRKIYRIK